MNKNLFSFFLIVSEFISQAQFRVDTLESIHSYEEEILLSKTNIINRSVRKKECKIHPISNEPLPEISVNGIILAPDTTTYFLTNWTHRKMQANTLHFLTEQNKDAKTYLFYEYNYLITTYYCNNTNIFDELILFEFSFYTPEKAQEGAKILEKLYKIKRHYTVDAYNWYFKTSGNFLYLIHSYLTDKELFPMRNAVEEALIEVLNKK